MKKSLILIISLLILDSCVDRILFSIPDDFARTFVVEGSITNEPGPYTVKISKAIKVDDSRPLGVAASVKKITLFNNLGQSEVLQEKEIGTYQTRADGMQGVIGNEYYIRIETLDGDTFESAPEKIYPVGEIDSLYYQFETIQPRDEPTEYGYRVFVDAHNVPGDNEYIRWRFTGIFIANTEPRYKVCPTTDPPCQYCPLPCSGALVGGQACTCCRCWVTQYEDKPTVNDQIASQGMYTAVEVGYVPVNYYSLQEKYRVQVEQMSLSANSYNYWSSIRNQKDAINSLFQPISGQIKTNLSEKNQAADIQGIFYAAAISKKQIYIYPGTNKVFINPPQDCKKQPREGPVGESCLLAFPGFGTSTDPPSDWR